MLAAGCAPLFYIISINVITISPFPPRTSETHLAADWTLLLFPMSSITVCNLLEVSFFRFSAPCSVKQVASTLIPRLSSFLARRFPNPESHPVISTYLSDRCSNVRLYLYHLYREMKTSSASRWSHMMEN